MMVRPVLRKLVQVFSDELLPLNVRLAIALRFARSTPPLRATRMRSTLLRWAGVQVGRGTIFGGILRIEGSARPQALVTFGRDCFINSGCVVDTSARVTIGDGVSLAQDVVILTGTHEFGPPEFRAGEPVAMPVMIGDGCWIGARAIILPGVTIGAGAVVAAGALVRRDVRANSLVAGVPARAIRELGDDKSPAP